MIKPPWWWEFAPFRAFGISDSVTTSDKGAPGDQQVPPARKENADGHVYRTGRPTVKLYGCDNRSQWHAAPLSTQVVGMMVLVTFYRWWVN